VSRKHESPGDRLLRAWIRTRGLPLGDYAFSWFVARMAPYTGSMGAVIRALEPGYARITLRDRRSVRNHLASVHAVALANLGELATGLAVTTLLPPAARGIPIRLSVGYLKKARGTITAEGRSAPPGEIRAPIDHRAVAELRDADGDMVAEVAATWRLGPA
jgi:acyl-coenzyme A thioesterase PaaI-like protein